MTNDRTDEFETAVQKIARKKNGDKVTTDDLWDLIIAVDKDGQTRDQNKLEMLKTQDARLKAVEENQKVCREHTEELIRREHDARHADHMAKYHSDDKERLNWVVGSSMVKIANVFWFVFGGVLLAIISYFIWGVP